jgi:hypothetical protein
MGAAVDDVHHRSWEQVSSRATEVTVQWLVRELCSGFCDRKRNTQKCVSSEVLLIRGSVKFTQGVIQAPLIQRIEPDELIGDFFVDVVNGLENTLPHVLIFVAIAKLPSFVSTGARTAWNRSSTEGTIDQSYVYLNGRIASGIEDLAALDVFDQAHG